MIVQRITAVQVFQPRITQVPIGRLSQTIESERIVGSGEREVTAGGGSIIDVSYVDVEVDTYSPKDVVVYGQQTHPRY